MDPGRVVGTGDHNQNRPYMICITKMGRLTTRNSKHIKATPITVDQYLWGKLGKSTLATVDDILKHFEKFT